MDFIKKYFIGRSIRFYVALGVAGLSIITSIVYAATLGHLGDYMSWAPFVLLLVSPFVYLALSVIGRSRIGLAVMSAMDFVAFLIYVGTIYRYPVAQVMVVASVGEIAEFPAIVVSAVLMLICIVASNVLAWMRIENGSAQESARAN